MLSRNVSISACEILELVLLHCRGSVKKCVAIFMEQPTTALHNFFRNSIGFIYHNTILDRYLVCTFIIIYFFYSKISCIFNI